MDSAFGGGDDSTPVSLSFLAPALEPDELGRLAHYRVLKALGQGGLGAVSLARDPRPQRPVALKATRPESDQSSRTASGSSARRGRWPRCGATTSSPSTRWGRPTTSATWRWSYSKASPWTAGWS